MEQIKSNVLFEVRGAKFVHQQKVMVKPVAHHYENDGEPEYIKYGCPICESIIDKYEKLGAQGLFENDEQFIKFSIPKGVANCPICGINLDWNEDLEKNKTVV